MRFELSRPDQPHVMSEGSGKKADRKAANDIRPEYDFTSMKGGVRERYAKRFLASTNLVLLEPDLAEAFPTDASVNDALRAVLKVAKRKGTA